MKNKIEQRAKYAIKDLKNNHNHSLYKEIKIRNTFNENKAAIIYRGRTITYGEMFQKADEYADSLAALGYTKGSQLLLCMSPTPEFYYLFLAACKIGAIINPVGEWFDKDYLKEIMQKPKKSHIFVTDDNYSPLKDLIDNYDNPLDIVLFSLNDSLPIKDGIKFDPFEEIDKKFKSFNNHFDEYKSLSKKHMINTEDFVQRGKFYSKKYGHVNCADVSLEDPCTITYTSGTTNPGKPKGVLHSIKSYMTISRFKDHDVSGMPPMRDMRVLAHFPTYVHAGLTTTLTDPFFQQCTVISEPIYDKDYFPYAIILNKPNYACASVGSWGNFSKLLENNEEFKDITCPYLFMATITGEGASRGEERFFNKVAKKHHFGTDKFPFNIVPMTYSIGGGTGESSGILVTLFKGTQEKRPYYFIYGYSYGLTPLSCTEVEVFNNEGYPCEVGEYGFICTRGECEMDGYYYQPELNKSLEYYDAKGQKWMKMGAYGIKNDNSGNIQIKGRIKDTVTLYNNQDFPLFILEDAVLMDFKHIMSCSCIKIEHEDVRDDIVIHFEKQPDRKINDIDLLKEVIKRLEYFTPEELKDHIYLRIRNNIESFPVAPSGKRNFAKLIEEGLNETISYRKALELINKSSKSLSLALKK